MSTFYDNFVRLCAEHKVSESRAAMSIGLSNAAASGWRKGKMPSNTTRIKLAEFFGVTVDELMGEGTKKEQPVDRTELLSAIDRALLDCTEEQKLAALRYIWGLQNKEGEE